MKWLVSIVAVLGAAAAACGDNRAGLAIVSPGSGSFVQTTAPLDLKMTGEGFGAAMLLASIDGTLVDRATSTLGSDCNPCDFDVTIPLDGVTPEAHEVKVELDVDLSEIAEASERLVFESPGAGSAR